MFTVKYPKGTTHLSVSKYNGEVEFFNDVNKNLSMSAKNPEIGWQVLPQGFTEKFLGGDTLWNAVQVKPLALENK